MHPLWYALQLARNELATWAQLHDADMGVYKALGVIDQAVRELHRQADAVDGRLQ